MAIEYAVRVHDSVGDRVRERLVTFCEETQGSFLVVRETDATRVHYQGWIKCDVNYKALRARFKKMFPDTKGNADYSLTFKKVETYIRYLLKGTKESLPDVVAYRGLDITQEFIKKEHEAYWAHPAHTGKSQLCIVEEIELWAKTQEFDNDDEAHRAVAEAVVDAIVSRKKPLNVHYARYVTNAVMTRRSAAYKGRLVSEIISKF